MSEIRWEEMFPDELEAAYQRCPLVYFTYGMCEPHGPQNAIGLDAIKAHEIACRAAEEHGGIVAPPDFWHVHEVGGYAVWAHNSIGQVKRHWMTSLPPWQHFHNVLYHVRTADALGFHAAIFLTGHYGPNWEDLKHLLEWVQPHVGTRLYGLPEFESNHKGFDGGGKETGDHAGKVETSLLWALRPELVDMSRIPAAGSREDYYAMGGTTPDSNRKIGDRMVADEVEFLGRKARELLEEYNKIKPEHTFLTYEDVERVWNEVVKDRVAGFESMQPLFEGQKPIPAESVWYRNMKISGNWK